MSDLRSVNLAAGLFFICAATAQAFAANDIGQSSVPNFSSADLPWSPIGAVRPPESGPGPIGTVSSDIVRRELVNGNGEIAERRLELMDVKNANLKPWAADAPEEDQRGQDCGKAIVYGACHVHARRRSGVSYLWRRFSGDVSDPDASGSADGQQRRQPSPACLYECSAYI